MSEFITLKKSDKEFKNYLLGTLPGGKVAVPVKSFNVGAEDERVTFKIEQERPGSVFDKLLLIAKNTQWGFLVYLLAPLMLLSSSYPLESLPWIQIIGILISIVCCYFSLVQFNAYFDHMRGSDRLSSEVGVVSSPIQKSIVSARFTYKIAWLNLLLGGLLGFYLLGSQLPSFLGIATFCILVIFGYSHKQVDLKGRALGEIFIFLGMGPVLFYGVALALGRVWDGNYLFMSLILGICSVVYLQARQLLHLMTDDKAQVKTLSVRLGFDKSVKFLRGMFNLCCLLLLFLSVMVDGLLALGVLPVFLWGFVKLRKKMGLVTSPLNSGLILLPGQIAVFHLFFFLVVSTIQLIGRL